MERIQLLVDEKQQLSKSKEEYENDLNISNDLIKKLKTEIETEKKEKKMVIENYEEEKKKTTQLEKKIIEKDTKYEHLLAEHTELKNILKKKTSNKNVKNDTFDTLNEYILTQDKAWKEIENVFKQYNEPVSNAFIGSHHGKKEGEVKNKNKNRSINQLFVEENHFKDKEEETPSKKQRNSFGSNEITFDALGRLLQSTVIITV